MKLLIINGPNINMLGVREKNIYGAETYQDLVNLVTDFANSNNVDLEVYQSNHEGALVDKIQQAYFDKVEGIVINPGAYTHYSYAIHDALKSVGMMKVEIHISDVDNREDFRKISVTAPACDYVIKGHGLPGYLEAIDYIVNNAN